MSYRIAVRNLKWITYTPELTKYFSQFGPIKNASVFMNMDTGYSRGNGFVEFQTAEGMHGALERPTHEIDGQQVDVQAHRRAGSRNWQEDS